MTMPMPMMNNTTFEKYCEQTKGDNDVIPDTGRSLIARLWEKAGQCRVPMRALVEEEEVDMIET